MNPTYYKVLEASTRHISKGDADLLTSGSPLMVHAKTGGWWVFCSYDDAADLRAACVDALEAGHSLALVDMLRFAWGTGCRWVELDCDAEDYGEDTDPVVDETTGLKWWPTQFDW